MRWPRDLRGDANGATALEFAIVAPIMLLIICGLLNLSFQAYLQAMLDGAVNDAARNSTLEGNSADQSAVDAKVRRQLRTVLGTAAPTFERLNFYSIADIGKPEDYEENGTQPGRQAGECYFDYNNNARYDLDRGRAGQGGANDFVQYKVTLAYANFFPIRLFGQTDRTTLVGTSVLRNQPYTDQAAVGQRRICT